ncbi:MAG: gliding motility-associated C-terminal domain-containing protein, partial [Bacteroidales bacterium]|nr:gliding motility-associated C-terminal domain-containing protein [Bacteroidales bacterium]
LGTTITRVDINTETHGNTYRWIWGDGYVSTSHMGDTVTHNYLKPGMYDVLCNMRALNGCADTSHYRINVYDYTRAEFKWHTLFGEITEPSMFFKNLSHIHEPEFNYYKWVFFNDSTDTNAIGFSNDYEAHYRWPVTDNSDVGFYRVRLVAYTPIRTPIHELLCMDSVDHIIYILNDFLQFPNTVTPNNDGINDIFEIKNLIDGKGFTETELHIYNSWGRMVYYKKNISIREDFWDPSLNNDPSGTYYYRFSAKGHCGNTHRNGVIQVIR